MSNTTTYTLKHTAEQLDHKLNLIDENKNLISYPYGWESVPAGLEDVGDGSILTSVQSDTSSETVCSLTSCTLAAGKKYVISLVITDILEVPTTVSGFALRIEISDQQSFDVTDYYVLDLTDKSEGVVAAVSLVVPSAFDAGLLIKPQIEAGSVATVWVPYMRTVGSYVDERFNSTNAKIKVLVNKIKELEDMFDKFGALPDCTGKDGMILVAKNGKWEIVDPFAEGSVLLVENESEQ